MKQYKWYLFLFIVSIFLVSSLMVSCGGLEPAPTLTPKPSPEPRPTPADQTLPSAEKENVIMLPAPQYDSKVSIEQCLLHRRSFRSYIWKELTLQEVSQLLWSAQGITSDRGFRTAPSAGALYPLEVYLVAGNVQNLIPGVYRYRPINHDIVKVLDGDKRDALAEAALMQSWVKEGAIALVFTAIYSRTTEKYGDRGIRYVHIELGHAAQNLCLQATAMELGAGTVGAFRDQQVSDLLNLPGDEQPLYIIPIGKTK
jgi:SagB-type dehydrogenase family enzyme